MIREWNSRSILTLGHSSGILDTNEKWLVGDWELFHGFIIVEFINVSDNENEGNWFVASFDSETLEPRVVEKLEPLFTDSEFEKIWEDIAKEREVI